MLFFENFDLIGLLAEIPAFTPFEAYWFVFSRGGWIVLLAVFLWGLWQYWVFYRQVEWWLKQKFIVLAIDVPKENEQTVLAVENIFDQLAGAHGSKTWWEANIRGQFQLAASFELVSIDGYVQYVIQAPEKWRDIIEASVYAQYPDAEINEIDDYVSAMPDVWPDPTWRFFGLEYIMKRPDSYPLRTHPEFEDKLSGEFKDPLAGLIEIMSKIGPGEQIWIQYVLTPIVEADYVPKAQEVVDGLIKRTRPGKSAKGVRKIFGWPMSILIFVLTFFNETTEPKQEEKREDGVMLSLPPGEKALVESIERKAARQSYRTKCRIMYFAKHEVYSKPRGVGAVIGAMKQFNSSSGNRWDVYKKGWPSTHYLFVKRRNAYRSNKLVGQYKDRSTVGGSGGGFILNVEELASLWHFPMIQVKAPMLKRTDARRAGAPFSLPISRPQVRRVPSTGLVEDGASPSVDDIASAPPELPVVEESTDEAVTHDASVDVEKKGGPPENLPFV